MKFKNARVEELYAKPLDDLVKLYFDTLGIHAKKSMSKIEICRRIEQAEFQRQRNLNKIPHIREIF